MGYRSNCVLSTNTVNTLSSLESNTLSGSSNRLTRAQLKTALTDTWWYAVGQLTNTQIDTAAAYSLYCAIDFSACQDTKTALARAHGYFLQRDTLADNAKKYRDSHFTALAWRAATPGFISNEVDDLLNALEAADADWDDANGYSPVQVFLTAYSLATCDGLADGPTHLQNEMNGVYNAWTARGCQSNGSPTGRKPFGDNGYLYAVPLNAILGSSVQDYLLQRIDQLN